MPKQERIWITKKGALEFRKYVLDLEDKLTEVADGNPLAMMGGDESQGFINIKVPITPAAERVLSKLWKLGSQ